ncbi:MAG: helix-turn-helix domain-containing protein, partial [Methanomicrobium sp.]|nr:helix-turn-helix domain-containing protein [Methanomicrobium sp.]
ELTEGTVSVHLEEKIREGADIDIGDLVSQKNQDEVLSALKSYGDVSIKDLRTLTEGRVPFNEIRFVKAFWEQKKERC